MLDARGRVARTLGAGTGLVAATREKDREPVWFVTGTDEAGVDSAAAAFGEQRCATASRSRSRRGSRWPCPAEVAAG